jgi:hypothetical protein
LNARKARQRRSRPAIADEEDEDNYEAQANDFDEADDGKALPI